MRPLQRPPALGAARPRGLEATGVGGQRDSRPRGSRPRGLEAARSWFHLARSGAPHAPRWARDPHSTCPVLSVPSPLHAQSSPCPTCDATTTPRGHPSPVPSCNPHVPAWGLAPMGLWSPPRLCHGVSALHPMALGRGSPATWPTTTKKRREGGGRHQGWAEDRARLHQIQRHERRQQRTSTGAGSNHQPVGTSPPARLARGHGGRP